MEYFKFKILKNIMSSLAPTLDKRSKIKKFDEIEAQFNIFYSSLPYIQNFSDAVV